MKKGLIVAFLAVSAIVLAATNTREDAQKYVPGTYQHKTEEQLKRERTQLLEDRAHEELTKKKEEQRAKREQLVAERRARNAEKQTAPAAVLRQQGAGADANSRSPKSGIEKRVDLLEKQIDLLERRIAFLENSAEKPDKK